MFVEIMVGIILALGLGLLFVIASPNRPSSVAGTWPFLLLLVLWTVAVGLWIEPIGPMAYGVTWAPYLFAALAFVLLFAVLPPRPGAVTSRGVAADEAVAFSIAVGMFFWVFALLLIGAIALAFVMA